MMATRRRADGRGGSGSRHRPRARAKSVHLEHEAKALLRRSGIATPVGRLVTSAEQASAVASELGGRVAMKVVSPVLLILSLGWLVAFLLGIETAYYAALDSGPWVQL